MKVTVDISEKDLKDIIRYTGQRKKGPAIAKWVTDALKLKRRRELSDQVLSGNVRLSFPHYEASRELDSKSKWDK